MLILLTVLTFGLVANAGQTPPSGASTASCPVTMPPDPPFIPPAAFAGLPLRGEFWYGTAALWTRLTDSSVWNGLPRNDAGYRQKVFYWRPGYDGRIEQQPALVVTLRRLDAAVSPVEIKNATNAYFDGMWSMLVGVDVPTPGCWDVSARYREAMLTFVVDVR
jgi:hypothetical protein